MAVVANTEQGLLVYEVADADECPGLVQRRNTGLIRVYARRSGGREANYSRSIEIDRLCDVRGKLSMKGIVFRYDRLNDIMELRWGHFAPSSEQELREVIGWLDEEATKFTGGRLCDYLIDLGGLTIRADLAGRFHQLRTEFAQRHMRRSYPFGGSNALRTAVKTSAVLQGARGVLFTDRQEALDALFRDRLGTK